MCIRDRRRSEEVGDDSLAAVGHKLGACGGLHPGVGNENPQRGQAAAEEDQPSGNKIELRAYLLAPENHDAQEHGLEEEGQQRLCRKRRAEDVSDETAVISPVRSEREFHGDTRGNTHSERCGEDFHPETRCRFILGIARAVIPRFVDGHDQADTDGQRNEYKVNEHDQSELHARKKRNIGQKMCIRDRFCGNS